MWGEALARDIFNVVFIGRNFSIVMSSPSPENNRLKSGSETFSRCNKPAYDLVFSNLICICNCIILELVFFAL